MKTLLLLVGGLLALAVLAVSMGAYSFNKMVEEEVNDLIKDASGAPAEVITHDDLEGLPEPVQRYFRYAIPEGQGPVKSVRLEHSGFFRTKPDGAWLPVQGEEYFSAGDPAFIWSARVKMNPLLWVGARDIYRDGEGNMLITVMSTFTVADVKAKELDQSSLIRWLAEATLFPTALLPREGLRWEEMDSNSARAVIEDHGMEVSAVFYFNGKGEITHLETEDRYMTVGDEQVRERWSAYYRDYKEMGGFMVPTEIEAVWNLEEGDFSYARFIVDEIEFDGAFTTDS